MQVLCLDMEGVLVPEIWIEFSKRTGIAEFSRTTRDEPDYDKLMRWRIALLAQHGLKLPDIQAVIAGMGPLPGAREFLDEMRECFQVVILSDTFYEFADPLMRQLGRPTLFCHRLQVDGDGRVRDYKLRQPDQKRRAVEALKGLNFRVMAAGDSYNDTGMLLAADAGFFIHAPPAIAAQFPQFPVTHSYAELKAAIDASAAGWAATALSRRDVLVDAQEVAFAVVRPGALGLGEQRERAAAHGLDELAVGLEAAGPQPQAAFVEAARAVHVLDRQHRGDSGIDQRGPSLRTMHAGGTRRSGHTRSLCLRRPGRQPDVARTAA